MSFHLYRLVQENGKFSSFVAEAAGSASLQFSHYSQNSNPSIDPLVLL